MRREFSVYLDLMRFTCAMTVFTAHMTAIRFTHGSIPYQGDWAGLAVVGFFVLSGYVIAYVSSSKEHNLSKFVISRLARVYSVAVPALLLTIAVDLLATKFHWVHMVPLYEYAKFPRYLVSALTFTDQSIFLADSAFGNGAYWSLCYEVWYYVIFAVAFFYRGWQRAGFLVLAVVLAGPLVLIYLPLWLLGVVIFHLHQRIEVNARSAIAIFACALSALLIVRLMGIDNALDDATNAVLHNWPKDHMRNSQHFVGHYFEVFFIAVSLFAANYMPLSVLRRPRIGATIVYLASFTFALYLMHAVLFDVFFNLFGFKPGSVAAFVTMAVPTLMTVWALGFVTEHRKFAWRQLFQKIVHGARDLMAQRLPLLQRIVTPGV